MFKTRAIKLFSARRNAVTAVKRVSNTRAPVAASVSSSANGQEGKAVSERPVETRKVASYGQPLRESFRGYQLESPQKAGAEGIQGLADEVNWAVSFRGLGSHPFDDSVQVELAKPLAPEDIEVKPDGLVYLPEIKYRRILNKAFGAGGWGLVPRSETIVTDKLVTREYALVCHGQLVSMARGEQDYFADSGIPTATEGCKSNALMRCCKDLGIGSELWDPVFIKSFKKAYCVDKFVEHVTTKKKRKIWLRKDREVEYPYK